MEQKTKVHAEDGRSDLLVTREFDLPLELLFKAYQDADIVEQWMGTKVIKLENKKHGSWQFQTTDANGNILFSANGTVHEFVENKRIVRTFEMDNAGFEVQLEFLEFEAINDDTSRLNMHIVYRSNAHRDQMLKLPFAYGINMAHDQLQQVASQLK